MSDQYDAREAIAAVGSDFVEFTVDSQSRYGPDGPLNWPGYGEARVRAALKSGEPESVVCGEAKIGGVPAVVIAFDFRYLGGSVGTATGDRIEQAFTRARETRTPLVSLISTGGSRMHEGMLSLRQLQRVARHSALLRQAGVPQVSVLRDPTTGGVWASLGAGADVVIGVEGARIRFAGRRVRPIADADDPVFTA
ncbi:MAG: acetyl-CoA carboxylase, partial [Actinomycetota bacterium]|nr:acetyl-CoA carboxylase [Actinomycetota bacterium]